MTLLSGLEPCRALNYDHLAPEWSSSVALFVTSPNARDAVSVRLAVTPSAGTAWLWVHAIVDGRELAYNVDHVVARRRPVDVLADDAVYETPAGSCRLARIGPRGAPQWTEIDVTVSAHEGLRAPDAPGPVKLRVHGRFQPAAAEGGTLPGRSELLGDADIAVVVDGEEIGRVAGASQWHEQHQDAPRFVTPFTYASLRGPSLSLIALIGPNASGGFARGEDGERTFDAAVIPEPEDRQHAFALHGPDGSLEGQLSVVHELIIPVYGRPWWGTLVAGEIDGHPVSGSVNRWRFHPEGDPFTPTGAHNTSARTTR